MSVRKRTWTTRKGETKEAWIVDYASTAPATLRRSTARRTPTPAKRRSRQRRQGVHIAPNKTPDRQGSGRNWIEACEAVELHRSSTEAYEQHFVCISSRSWAAYRLAQLTTPLIREFVDNFSQAGCRLSGPRRKAKPKATTRSVRQAMTKRVVVSLGTMFADAQERGLVATNVARGLKTAESARKRQERDQRGKLKAGVDIPSPTRSRRSSQIYRTAVGR